MLEAAASSLATYEKLFGRYPYVDLDVVEAPLVGGAGGVEFSGLVTVASMLYRPALSEGPMGMLAGLLGGAGHDARVKELTDSMLEFVTAHEVAHQWWPGLVGSDSRQHPFQDEALAQWSAVLHIKERYGPERAKLEADRKTIQEQWVESQKQLQAAAGQRDRHAADLQARAKELQQAQAQLLAHLRRELAVLDQPDPQRDAGAPDARAQEERRRQLVRMLAEIERRVNEENARPKKRYISPATREEVYAIYYDKLRRAIEDKGTENFPELAGKKLYGELTMICLLYTSPSPRDRTRSRMPSSA